ncbi:MAG TPA: hypothetical protein VMS77_00800, partial [Conexivisphaerales archaeon]|nr:hypothetical protein [Conexivisphaerales archaeon]
MGAAASIRSKEGAFKRSGMGSRRRPERQACLALMLVDGAKGDEAERSEVKAVSIFEVLQDHVFPLPDDALRRR